MRGTIAGVGQLRFLLAAYATTAAACGRIDFAPLTDGSVAPPARAIQVSYIDACSIDNAGYLWCWGADAAGELGDGGSRGYEKPVQVMPGTWREVATGGVVESQAFTCAIRDDGTLWCFGENYDGELGDGTTTASPTPVQVGAETWQHIATGIDCNACAIRDDGTLWCWGGDTAGGCGGWVGDGAAADALVPVEIASGTWLDVSIGYGDSCAIRADHTLWCWGYGGGDYNFGNDDTQNLNVPTQIGTDASWSQVWMSSRRGCAQRDDGTLWCWGDNSDGQAGDGTTALIMTAEPIAPGMSWSAVTVADTHTCAIDTTGSLWCWGQPTYGVFGVDLAADVTTPLEVDASGGWTAISAGDVTTCGIHDGIVVCSGEDQFGQLGDGGSFQPAPVAMDAGWAALAGGFEQMCGLELDGTVWCWGNSGHGVFGSAANDKVPIEVSAATWSAPFVAGNANVCATSAGEWWCWGSLPAPSPVIEPPTDQGAYSTLSVGEAHACGIRADDTLWCWGETAGGELGVIGSDGSPTQVGVATWRSVAAGFGYTCAIETDGTLWCWGRNDSLQTGQPTGSEFDVPTQVGAATDWAQVFAGSSSATTCATKTSGLLFCWGFDDDAQAGDGGSVLGVAPTQVTSATDWSDVSVGSFYGCGLRSGAVWCWGNGTLPTELDPATFVQVVTSQESICALDNTGTRWCWGDDSHGALGDDHAWSTAFAPVAIP